MSFLAPAAFALAVLAGPLVALYMLRSRRLRVDVPSTMLWQDVGASVSSAIPWQRLKVTPLLILQLIALALLVVALARPFFAQETLLGPHTVLVVDTSGSMATGNRFDRAIARAMELSADVTESNLVSIVEAGPAPRVVLAFSRDADTVAAALLSLGPTGGVEKLDEGLRLARGLETPDRPTSILVLSDGGPEGAALAAEPVVGATHLRFDDRPNNVGIAAFSTDASTEGIPRLFVELANWSEQATSESVQISVNGLPAASLSIDLEPLARGRAILPIDAGAGDVVEATRMGDRDGNPLDDSAVLMMASSQVRSVSLIGEGSTFLDALIRSVPDFVPAAGAEPDLVIVDGGTLPDIDRPAWLIRPDTPPDGVTVAGTAQNLVVTFQQPGEPLLDQLDLSELVVGEAQIVEAPAWLPIVRAGDTPLILVGTVNGHRAVYFTFDITHSNLPVQLAFPILGARIFEFLAGTSPAAVTSETAGSPIVLTPPANSTVRITEPTGTVVDVPTGSTTFRDTGAPGVYRVSYVDEAGTVNPGPVAIRSFAAGESAGGFRDIEVAGSAAVEADRATLVREWAAWFLATVVVLLLLEWWVGHRRPVRARGAEA